MDAIEVRFTGEVQRLTLQPGDVLVVRVDQTIDGLTAERIKEAVIRLTGSEKCLVLGKELSIEILNPSAA